MKYFLLFTVLGTPSLLSLFSFSCLMPIPGILKSKAFWSFSTVASGISGAVAYDRYQASLIYKAFLEEATNYGKQPLPLSESPRTLNFFLMAADSSHHRAIRDNFYRYAVGLLTAAGIDYKWCVEVDGEEVARKWDEIAREANKPELMLDDASSNKTVLIPLEELEANLLSSTIKAIFTRFNPPSSNDFKDNIWTSLRQKFTSIPFERPRLIEIVTFDRFTEESITKEIDSINTNSIDTQVPVIESKSSKSWFSRSTKKPSQTILPVSSTTFHIPCDYPQTLSARLMRFLFGQQEITKTIGESVIEIIRNQNSK